jgi:hypothetical protein
MTVVTALNCKISFSTFCLRTIRYNPTVSRASIEFTLANVGRTAIAKGFGTCPRSGIAAALHCLSDDNVGYSADNIG